MRYPLASEVTVRNVTLSEDDGPAFALSFVEEGHVYDGAIFVTRQAAWDMAQAILRDFEEVSNRTGMTTVVTDRREGERRLTGNERQRRIINEQEEVIRLMRGTINLLESEVATLRLLAFAPADVDGPVTLAGTEWPLP